MKLASKFPGRPGLRLAAISPPDIDAGADAAQFQDAVQTEADRQKARARVARDSIIHLGADSVFDISGTLRNPVAFLIVVPVNLVAFTVPGGVVLEIDQMGITYSNPLVSMSICVGWRIVIDNGRVPNVVDPANEFFYHSFGAVNDPMKIKPLWVQSGQTVALQLFPAANWTNQLTIVGRLSGRFYKPGSEFGEVI